MPLILFEHFLLLVHINTWSKRSVKSLIVARKVFDVKKALPGPRITLNVLTYIVYRKGRTVCWFFL